MRKKGKGGYTLSGWASRRWNIRETERRVEMGGGQGR